MRVDRYQPCPCGSGKKIKFCCSNDIVEDLSRILRMSEGDQRMAALDLIESLLKKKPDRPSLLSLKGMVQMQLGQLKEAQNTVVRFKQAAPDSAVAHAQSAMLEAASREVQAAVTSLQRALELSGDELPLPVYDAIGVIADLLFASGHILAARGHYLMQAATAGDDDPEPLSKLLRVNQSPEVPVLLKDDPTLAECPESAAWKADFEAAMELYERGVWRAACDRFKQVAEKASGESCVLENIAILEGLLANVPAAVAAYRQFAHLDGIDPERAVEAEAIAQLMDPNSNRERIDVLQVTYLVSDAPKLLESLLSNRRAASMPIDPAQLGKEGAPPPKAAFWILDKPLAESGKDITREEVSRVIGELILFGRETDREARMELVVSRSADFEEKLQSILELDKQSIGAAQHERVVTQVTTESDALSSHWHLPEDTPPERRQQLTDQELRHAIFERWSNLSLTVLDKKTPKQASQDPYYHLQLQAAILLLELTGEQRGWEGIDFNELRESFGLPVLQPIDPQEVEIADLPLVRLSRLLVDKLENDDLVTLFGRATLKNVRNALVKFARQVVDRDNLDEKVDKARAYAALARNAKTPDEALSFFGKAANEARSKGRSPAMYLLSELDMRIRLGHAERAQQLIESIKGHSREPGVQETLIRILASYGLIRPDGLPKSSPQEAEEPLDVDVADRQDSVPGLWTPDSAETPASPGPSKESKIWVPGSD